LKGSNKGFAFVEYTDADDASEAIYNLDGSELYGKVLSVSLAKEGQGRLDTNKAVWSTDDFFQETIGQGEEKQDTAVESLKEGGVKL
jgi:RNA recognition motif-containing protein